MEKKDNYEPKKCESCGAEFVCGANADNCWCADAELSADSTLILKASYNDCLCRKCLLTHAVSDPANVYEIDTTAN